MDNLDLGTRVGAEASDQIKYLSERIPSTFVLAGVDLEGNGLFAGRRGGQISSRYSLIRTNGVRLELTGRGITVTGVHLGAADTDMMAGFDVPKLDPVYVVATALDGVAAGRSEVLVDDASRAAKAALAGVS